MAHLSKLIPYSPGLPIRQLEKLWLISTVAYEEFDENVMADTDWDQMGKELYARRKEWTPYFKQCLPSPRFNTGTTGSGLNWQGNVTGLFYDEFRTALRSNTLPLLVERYSRG